ncbi:hypothetical protein TYRP_001601 [Tyrophagus putrescentiae]|nr:hypothetical protein TYRP_001601 [Tyrophagus putrescentiae]
MLEEEDGDDDLIQDKCRIDQQVVGKKGLNQIQNVGRQVSAIMGMSQQEQENFFSRLASTAGSAFQQNLIRLSW